MATITASAGGGNWTAGASWVGGVAPTAADDAVLDATSGNITIDSGAVCRSLNCTGYTGILTHTAAVALNIGDGTAGVGNIALKLVAGMTYTLGSSTTSEIKFISTSATVQTVETGGQTLASITFVGVAGSWQLTDAFSCKGIILTSGTLNTNGQAVTTSATFSISGTLARVLTLGASTITCYTWTATTTTNLTFNVNTSTIIQTGPSTFDGGALTYNVVSFTSTGDSTIAGANTFGTLQKNAIAGYCALLLDSDQTVTGTLTLVGANANSQRLLVAASDYNSSASGTKKTITCNGAITLTNVDFCDITGAGSASWTGTSIGNCGNNSGITFTAAVNRYWVGNGGNYHGTANWAASSGGAGGQSMPLPQDSAFFDANSFSAGSQTVNVISRLRVGNISFTGATNTPAFGHGTYYVYFFGNVTFISAMTFTSHHWYLGRGSHTLTMNSFEFSTTLMKFDCATGTYTMSDDFVSGASLDFRSGIIDANDNNITVAGVSFVGSIARTLTLGNGTWTLTGTSPWSGSSMGNVTINAEGSTIKITDSSNTAINFGFAVGTYTYNVVWFARGASTGSITILRSSTFGEFKDTGTEAHSLLFTTGTTQTVTTFTVSGTIGKEITINSTTTGTHDLTKAGGGVVSCDYLNIQHSVATPADTWYAGANSTDNQAVATAGSRWIFTAAPGGSKNLLLLGVG